LKELDSLHEKKEYPNARVFFFKIQYEKPYQIRKNYEIYMGKEMEG